MSSIIIYPSMIYTLKDGSLLMDIPDLQTMVTGKDYLDLIETADEVATGVVLFLAKRDKELPEASRDIKLNKSIRYVTSVPSMVAVSMSHYTNIENQ